MRTVTLRKIINNIKRVKEQGIPWTRGTVYEHNYGRSGASCAVGLAVRGLYPEIVPKTQEFYNTAYTLDRKIGAALGFSIIGVNDNSSSFERMISKLETIAEDRMDVEFTI